MVHPAPPRYRALGPPTERDRAIPDGAAPRAIAGLGREVCPGKSRGDSGRALARRRRAARRSGSGGPSDVRGASRQPSLDGGRDQGVYGLSHERRVVARRDEPFLPGPVPRPPGIGARSPRRAVPRGLGEGLGPSTTRGCGLVRIIKYVLSLETGRSPVV